MSGQRNLESTVLHKLWSRRNSACLTFFRRHFLDLKSTSSDVVSTLISHHCTVYFANSRRQVYINLHHDLPAIVTCLEEKVLLSCQNPAVGKLKEKANEAKQCLGKLLNERFLLTLAGCADV